MGNSRDIIDYRLVMNERLQRLGEDVADCVDEGWQFMNKMGIQRSGTHGHFYVEMVKYEEEQVVAQPRDMTTLINATRQNPEYVANRQALTQHIEDFRQGVGTDLSSLTPIQRDMFHDIVQNEIEGSIRRSAVMPPNYGAQEEFIDRTAAQQIRDADIGTDERGRVYRAGRGWINEEEEIGLDGEQMSDEQLGRLGISNEY